MKNHYKIWIIFSLIIVFTAGITGGILLDRYMMNKKPERETRKRTSIHFPTLTTMAEELNLTASQQEQIRSFFENNEESFKNLRGHIRERLTSMRTQLITDIKSVLNAEQSNKFDAMIEKYLTQRKNEIDKRKKNSQKQRENKGEEK